jgi:ABC-2 type transport system permease protein
VIRLIRAELLKLRTTQVWFWLLLASVAITVTGVVAGLAPHNGVQNIHDIAAMLGSATTADIAVFVLGALAVTTEFRYQTITPTVLISPSRWTLVTAKMITYALVGAAYSLACVVVELAIAAPWLSAKGFHVSFTSGPALHALVAAFVIVTLHGLIGMGAGALMKNQIVAVTVGLLFLLVLENLIVAIPKVKSAFPYTPSGAANSLIATNADDRVVNHVHLLPVAGGVVVLVLWALIPAIIGAAYTLNRDIT